jgi:hypothetical protein
MCLMEYVPLVVGKLQLMLDGMVQVLSAKQQVGEEGSMFVDVNVWVCGCVGRALCVVCERRIGLALVMAGIVVHSGG